MKTQAFWMWKEDARKEMEYVLDLLEQKLDLEVQPKISKVLVSPENRSQPEPGTCALLNLRLDCRRL